MEGLCPCGHEPAGSIVPVSQIFGRGHQISIFNEIGQLVQSLRTATDRQTHTQTDRHFSKTLFQDMGVMQNRNTLKNLSRFFYDCCCWVLRHFLTSQVISVASDIEREKSDKFCSEVLVSVCGSFTCRKSTTRNPWLYFPSEGSHTHDFYALKNPSTLAGIEPANLGSRGEYDYH